MALIRCTECGKDFSDRASACPMCGCPTSCVLEDIANGVKAPESDFQKIVNQGKSYMEQASGFLKDGVEKTKTKAETIFEKTESQKPGEKLFCGQCGTRLKEKGDFYHNCGAKVK